jgi:hypothetical protein
MAPMPMMTPMMPDDLFGRSELFLAAALAKKQQQQQEQEQPHLDWNPRRPLHCCASCG